MQSLPAEGGKRIHELWQRSRWFGEPDGGSCIAQRQSDIQAVKHSVPTKTAAEQRSVMEGDARG